jgi:hypothetical protein
MSEVRQGRMPGDCIILQRMVQYLEFMNVVYFWNFPDNISGM